ncbi:DUF3103 family protein [Streptomyces wedmorensis]
MTPPRAHRKALAVAALAFAVLAAGQSPAAPATGDRADATSRPRAEATGEVHRIENHLAQQLAATLADPTWRTQLRTAVGTRQISLNTLTTHPQNPAARQLADTVADADRKIASLKGLGAGTGGLLTVQLADPAMRRALDAGQAPLVAAAIGDDHATGITAYDQTGRVRTLATRTLPDQPVYLVDVDAAKTLTAGLDVLRTELARRGITTTVPTTSPAAAASGGWWATKIDAIAVSDDQEPWFKGAAEMFALVTGFGTDGKVRVDSVAMPYLQYEGTVYRPNQILVNWSSYKYNLADVVLMEDDGDTNYRALAQAIAAVLLTVADLGVYVPLVNAVLQAIPDSWWTDDPDYVESWYTLAKTSTGRLSGASGNGWMSVQPYFVQQL